MDSIGRKDCRFQLCGAAGFLFARKNSGGLSWLALVICPAITFYLFDFYTHNPFTSMDFETQVLNIVFYELLGLVMFGLFRHLRLALMIQSGFFMALGLVNYYVLNFRSTPIMPWDLYSLSTAVSVADNFSYALEQKTLLVLAGFAVLLLLESRCGLKAPGRKRFRLVLVLLPLLMLNGYAGMVQNENFVRHFGLYDKFFTPAVMNKRDGNVVAFLMGLEYLKVQRPENYSAEKAQALLGQKLPVQGAGERPGQGASVQGAGERPGQGASVQGAGEWPGQGAPVQGAGERPGQGASIQGAGERSGQGASVQGAGERPGQGLSGQGTGAQQPEAPAAVSGGSLRRPNILVVMDEAFSDPALLGELETNADYMPFIHSLQKGADNTITGYLNVSVLGGNTANTEFEFLTGNTMAFLPEGSVAYQQYVQKPVPSLASHLSSLGYSAIAIHPYYADGWDRDRVYPLLGFGQFLSKEDFSGAPKIRSYVSDQACFDRIKRLYETKESGVPLFVFNVTMQNHSGYDEDFANFLPDIETVNFDSDRLGRYLSLIKRTDRAFEDLVSYFEQAEEDTIIVFFGDHQPASYVTAPVRQNSLYPGEEDLLLYYKVPYVIWSNFDIPSASGRETSPNFLALDVLERCGLPLSSYQECLQELREEWPVISGRQVRDKSGRTAAEEEYGKALGDYRTMQYYLLFDQ